MPPETRARITTDLGDIVIRFFPDVAPNHVANFLDLAKRHWYDGKIFHRIIPNFYAESERVTSDTLIDRLLEAVPIPRSGM